MPFHVVCVAISPFQCPCCVLFGGKGRVSVSVLQGERLPCLSGPVRTRDGPFVRNSCQRWTCEAHRSRWNWRLVAEGRRGAVELHPVDRAGAIEASGVFFFLRLSTVTPVGCSVLQVSLFSRKQVWLFFLALCCRRRFRSCSSWISRGLGWHPAGDEGADKWCKCL